MQAWKYKNKQYTEVTAGANLAQTTAILSDGKKAVVKPCGLRRKNGIAYTKFAVYVNSKYVGYFTYEQD